MKFEMPKDQTSIIKVIGVGGGGSNAVNHMYNQGIKGVDFIVCNTDSQALDISPVPVKVQLGESLTEGRGAGSIPEVGKNAAIETIDAIKNILEKNTTMVFITAGMGGGTGTGAAPIIAKTAKDMGILTVGIVTVPFVFEGRKRRQQAEDGLNAMRDAVDTLLVIKNDKLREMYGNLSLKDAFSKADDILTTAAKGIAEVISVTGDVNVDMNDVNTVMRNSGVAIMGQASASGENRAIRAVQEALESPLLNDNDIKGAKYILLNITYGNEEVMMDEIADITDYIQDAAGSTADVIWGHGKDADLGDKISVTIIATGFNGNADAGLTTPRTEKKYVSLDADLPTMITKPLDKPISAPIEKVNVEVAMLLEEQPYLKGEENIKTEIQIEVEKQTSTVNESSTEMFIKTKEINQERGQVIKSEEQIINSYKAPTNEVKEERVRYFNLYDEQQSVVKSNEEIAPTEQGSKPTQNQSSQYTISHEEQQKKALDRIARIKELSMKVKTTNGIADLENEPAYKRKNVRLENVQLSTESQVSRYTLSEDVDEDGERRTEIRANNPFLHDNVD
jgi:cell division protein FtsZ